PTTANSPTSQTMADRTAIYIRSLVDLVAQKTLPPIDLGALRFTHGLVFSDGKIYFTAETNKIIGRNDPASQRVDWILGTGQDRSPMITVSKSLDQIITSNVNSGTISIIKHVAQRNGGSGPRPGGPAGSPNTGGPQPQGPERTLGSPRLTWEVTNVLAGIGVEGFDVSPDGKEL